MTRILMVAALFSLCTVDALAINVSHVWLSTTGTIPPGPTFGDVPEVNLHSSDPSQEIYVWGRPAVDKTLEAWSLNLRSSHPDVIRLTGVTVHNPFLGTTGPLLNKDIFRHEFVADSNNDALDDETGPDLLQRFQGFRTGNHTVIGAGMGSGTTAFDPLYDTVNDAWLMATVSYEMKSVGHTELYLQIGSNGWLHDLESGEGSINESVVFGDPTDPGLNGNNDRQIDSATPDATIWTVPEPPTSVLLAVALVGIACLWSKVGFSYPLSLMRRVLVGVTMFATFVSYASSGEAELDVLTPHVNDTLGIGEAVHVPVLVRVDTPGVDISLGMDLGIVSQGDLDAVLVDGEVHNPMTTVPGPFGDLDVLRWETTFFGSDIGDPAIKAIKGFTLLCQNADACIGIGELGRQIDPGYDPVKDTFDFARLWFEGHKAWTRRSLPDSWTCRCRR